MFGGGSMILLRSQFSLRILVDFRYVGAIQDPTTGSVIDRYSVPQRGVVPVRTVVPEVQEYQVYGQTMVPEVIRLLVTVYYAAISTETNA
jgi:hypothetical protein